MAGNARTILVVDDDEFNRSVLATVLVETDYRVEEAGSGAAALERLRRGGVDLVLLDLVMPGMDGYEVLERVRSDRALKDVPVVVLSGEDDRASRARSLELGATGYLPKPLDFEALAATLSELLQSAPEDRKPTTEAEASVAPDAPGIDVAEGMRRLQISADAFCAMLRRSADGIRGLLDAAREASDRGDAGALRRAAHSLAGVAGNASATALHETARALERNAAQDGADLSSLVGAVAKEAELVLASIASLPAPALAPAVPPPQANAKAFAAALSALAQRLDESDLTGVQETLASARAAGVPSGLAQEFDRMTAFAKSYDFDRAADVARGLLEGATEMKGP